ncbi:MAG: hypothetical protein LBH85_01975 [Treponema sp.]|jgi:hypothetical protein|nr:hypothetical protein [Treponema sp.]
MKKARLSNELPRNLCVLLFQNFSFGTAALDFKEKAGFRLLFPEPVSKLEHSSRFETGSVDKKFALYGWVLHPLSNNFRCVRDKRRSPH